MIIQTKNQLTPPISDQEYFCTPISIQLGGPQKLNVTIEAATVAGDLQKPNEDCFAIRYSASTLSIAVFDGATSLKRIPAHDTIGMSGARFASHFLRDSFLTVESFDGNTLCDLNRALRERVSGFVGLDVNDVNTVPTSTATIVLIDSEKDLVSIQHVSDSFCLAKNNTGKTSLITPDPLQALEDRIYSQIREIARSQGISNRDARNNPEIASTLLKELQKSHNAANGKGAGVVNGDPQMEQYVFRTQFPLSSLQALLIGSDGLPAPQNPLTSADNIEKLMMLVESGGVRHAIAYKKQSEDQDLDWESARWKHSDDATGVYLRFS
jgi:hypothetical protein